MNNSKLAIESINLSLEQNVDLIPTLLEQEAEFVKILDAIRAIRSTVHWGTLKTYIFDSLTASLHKDLEREARKDQPDPLKLTRVSGQLKWAERFSDLSKLEQEFKAKLVNVRLQLNGSQKE